MSNYKALKWRHKPELKNFDRWWLTKNGGNANQFKYLIEERNYFKEWMLCVRNGDCKK